MDICGTEGPFTDVPSSSWSCKYIKRLVELGITAGVGEGFMDWKSCDPSSDGGLPISPFHERPQEVKLLTPVDYREGIGYLQ